MYDNMTVIRTLYATTFSAERQNELQYHAVPTTLARARPLSETLLKGAPGKTIVPEQ